MKSKKCKKALIILHYAQNKLLIDHGKALFCYNFVWHWYDYFYKNVSNTHFQAAMDFTVARLQCKLYVPLQFLAYPHVMSWKLFRSKTLFAAERSIVARIAIANTALTKFMPTWKIEIANVLCCRQTISKFWNVDCVCTWYRGSKVLFSHVTNHLGIEKFGYISFFFLEVWPLLKGCCYLKGTPKGGESEKTTCINSNFLEHTHTGCHSGLRYQITLYFDKKGWLFNVYSSKYLIDLHLLYNNIIKQF